MKGKDLTHFACFLFLAVFIPALHAAIQYEIIDLGANMNPIAISNNGKVLLSEEIGYMDHKLYVWDHGQTALLDHFPQGNISVAAGINNNGEVTANIQEDSPFTVYACHWKDGPRITYPDVYLWDMNNHGQILGSGSDEDNAIFMFVIQSDGQKIIYEKYTIGTSFNDYGHITGTYTAGTYNDIGMIWNPDGTTRQILDPLEGHLYSCGLVLNNQNQVLGYSTDAFVYDDFDLEISLVLWDPAEGRIDLNCSYGFYHGRPFDINDQGQIVGMLKRPGDSDFEPYLWQKETGFINLKDLVQGIDSVYRIDNQGTIIGRMGDHGILLVPVPEPGSLVLMLLGAGLIRKMMHAKKP